MPKDKENQHVLSKFLKPMKNEILKGLSVEELEERVEFAAMQNESFIDECMCNCACTF